MKKTYYSIGLIFVFFITLFMLPVPATHSHSGDEVGAKPKISDPVIDGNFNVLSEWNDATVLHLTTPFEVFVYLKYDADFLYVCEDATGDTSAGSDYGNLMFDTNHDGLPTPDHDDIFSIMSGFGGIHGIDDSGAGYNPVLHCMFDAHVGLEGATSFGPSPNSGVNHQIYEFKIPLDLINLTTDNTVGMAIYVVDDSGGPSMTVWPDALVMADLSTWGNLFLESLFPQEITVTDFVQTPIKPTPIDVVDISANISCINAIQNATIWYSPNGTTWLAEIMSLQAGSTQDGLWKTTLPQQAWNTSIEYYLVIFNNISENLKLGPYYYDVLGYEYPIINNVTQLPANLILSTDSVKINCSITDQFAGITSVFLLYDTNNSGSFTPVQMNLTQGSVNNGVWNGTIPAFSNDTEVSYFILAGNAENLSSLAPQMAPDGTYGYLVGAADLEPPLFMPGHFPDPPSWSQDILIQAWVNSTREISGVKNLTLAYRLDNGPEIVTLMDYYNAINISSIIYLNYSYYIDAQPYNTTVKYNVTAYDILDNQLTIGPNIFVVNDTDAPLFTIIESPVNPTQADPLDFKINLIEQNGSGIQNCTLYYQMNETTIYPQESPHPYPNNYNNNWTFSQPNATSIVLKFQKIDTEPDSDFLVVYDQNDAEIFRFNGTYQWNFISEPLTVVVPGNKTKVQLTSDFLVSRWGYKLLECTAVLPTMNKSMDLTEGTKITGNWTTTLGLKSQNTRITYLAIIYDNENNFNMTPEASCVIGENIAPVVTNVFRNKQYPHSTDTVNITATALDNYYLPYNGSAFINYTVSGFMGSMSFYEPMSRLGTSDDYYVNSRSWSYIMPDLMFVSQIEYRIEVQDMYSNMDYSPVYTCIVDDDEPLLQVYQYPAEPNYLDTVSIQVAAVDSIFIGGYGSGVKNVSIIYSSEAHYTLESPHPVSNNYIYTWNVSQAGATQLRLHFSTIDLENQYDYISIYDSDWNFIQNFTDLHTNQWTDWVNGDTLRVKIVTDFSGQSWGFTTDKINYFMQDQLSLVSGTNQSGSWEFEFSGLEYGQSIEYYIEAYDFHENYIREPFAGIYDIVVDDTITPTISGIKLDIPDPNAYQDVPITLNVHENGSGIENVTLCISLNGGLTWSRVLMNQINSTSFNATIPGQAGGSSLTYYFMIYDTAGNPLKNPTSGFYTLSFAEDPPPGELIPMWLFYLIMGILLGVIVGAFLFYRGKKVIAPPPRPKPPPPKPPVASVPKGVATPKPSPAPTERARPKKISDISSLENKYDDLILKAADAMDNNNLQLAHTLLLQAIEVARELKIEDLVKETLAQAELIKERMKTPSPPPSVTVAPSPPAQSEISPPLAPPIPPTEPPTPSVPTKVPKSPTPAVPEVSPAPVPEPPAPPTHPTEPPTPSIPTEIPKPPTPVVPEISPPPSPETSAPTEEKPSYKKWTMECPHCGRWVTKASKNCPYCRNPIKKE